MPGNPALTANPLVGSVQFDPSFTRAVNVPCAGIRVVAMDADNGFDEFCGAAYTDSRGQVNFRGECGDLSHPSPEVYLRIEGRSLNGFSVGIIEPNLFERILDQRAGPRIGGLPRRRLVRDQLRLGDDPQRLVDRLDPVVDRQQRATGQRDDPGAADPDLLAGR